MLKEFSKNIILNFKYSSISTFVFFVVLQTALYTCVIFSTGVSSYVNLRQPNGYTFVAIGEGDEFLQRFKTQENYTIVCSTGNWWYYANQGTDGKLYPTQYRVGIEDYNAKLNLTENINYSQSIIENAKNQRISANSNLTLHPLGPVSVGIILIDFPDRIAARTDPNNPNDPLSISHSPSNSSWEKRYTMNDFQKLFFSTNTYNTNSPDGYPVYGSVNDYYKQTSYNQVFVTGAILNNSEPNGKPIWYRANFNSYTYTPVDLRTEALTKAIAAGFNPSNYDKICVIYAGPWGGSLSNLWPMKIFGTNTWIMGERNSAWDGDYGFASIGVHVHEMAHTLGLPDLYAPTGTGIEYGCGVGGYCLMGYGNMGAKINRHSKPVLMSAWAKSKLGYLTPETVTVNQMNKSIPNIEQNPFALKIVIYNYAGDTEYLIVENRQPIGFDSDIPIGGILISHYNSDGTWYNINSNLLDIEEVGGLASNGCGSEKNQFPLDFYIRPLSCNSNLPNSQVESGDFMNITGQVFSPWSYPNSNRAGISLSSDVAIVFKSYGSTSYIDVYKDNAILAPPSKQPLGAFRAGDGPIYYGWAYLAWGTDYFYNPFMYPMEPDYVWSELQRKIGDNGNWQTVYSGPNRYWSDHSIVYDPENGDTPVYFRVRVRDNQNLWSIWSDLFNTKTFTFSEGNFGAGKTTTNTSYLPQNYELGINYPNPFNPSTIINFAVKEAGLVNLKVYDILGAEVAELVNEVKEAGYHSVEFNASNLPSGVYIYNMEVNGFSSSKKMLLMK